MKGVSFTEDIVFLKSYFLLPGYQSLQNGKNEYYNKTNICRNCYPVENLEFTFFYENKTVVDK